MKELEKYMEHKIITWLTSIGQELNEYLKEFIYSEYYDQYKPTEWYDRKYRIISAIMVSSIKKVGKAYELSVYLDPTKVSYDPAVWYDKSSGSWGYIMGDAPEDVFNLIANGIHGSAEFGQTEGRFWDTFIESIDKGGVYDIFEDFKRYLINSGLMVIT